MTLYESKYGVITQPNETTFIAGNYQVVLKNDLWELSRVPTLPAKTWLESTSLFHDLNDALRVAIVFTKEDGLAPALKDLLMIQGLRGKSSTRSDSEHLGDE